MTGEKLIPSSHKRCDLRHTIIRLFSRGEVLQTDLVCLEHWKRCGICNLTLQNVRSSHITRKVQPLNTKYTLHDVELESVSAAKYLGVTIADDLSWTSHGPLILTLSRKKQTKHKEISQKKHRVHNKDLKSVAYKTLVRPQLEYASTVWYPHHDNNIIS